MEARLLFVREEWMVVGICKLTWPLIAVNASPPNIQAGIATSLPPCCTTAHRITTAGGATKRMSSA